MKELKLKRFISSSKSTLSALIDPDEFIPVCYTLENPWLGNQEHVSCIPEGRYRVLPYSGDKYKNVFKLSPVIDRTDILIHVGNYEKNTQGCLLPGMSIGETKEGEPAVWSSSEAMEKIKLKYPEGFYLEVTL